jgi:cupin 2 domain-containing protein
MTIPAGNLFADISAASAGGEAFCEIFARPGLKIERIISQGQASPPEFWYDQAWNEWVIVLKGSAILQFEDEPATRALGAGDYVFIPAIRRRPPPSLNGQQQPPTPAADSRLFARQSRRADKYRHAVSLTKPSKSDV